MDWVKLEIEYFRIADSLLFDMTEDEWDEFLDCEDCCLHDYECLLDELARTDNFEPIKKVKAYMNKRYVKTAQEYNSDL